jgi:hypothetical protein
MARPSSRLLSRTTTRRTTPVFAAEAGSDTENGDACDIVEGILAEVGNGCQLPVPNSQLPKMKFPTPNLQATLRARWELGVGRWEFRYRALAAVPPDCASAMKYVLHTLSSRSWVMPSGRFS